WYEFILELLTNIPGKIKGWLETWWTTVSEGFDNAKEIFSNGLKGFSEVLLNWFTKTPKEKEVKNTGKEIVKEMAEGTMEQEDDFTNKLGKVVVDVLLFVAQAAAIVALAAGRELITRIGEGVTNMKDDLSGKFSATLKAGIEGARSWLSNAFNTGKEFVNRIIDGIVSRISSLKTGAKVAAKKGAAGAKEAYNNFLQAGKDMVSGFIKGIQSKPKELWNAATNLATSAWTAVKSKLNINSPSRLMMSVGDDFGEGFVVGIERSIGNVIKASDKFAEAAVPDLSKSVDLNYSTPNSMHSTLSSAVNGTVD